MATVYTIKRGAPFSLQGVAGLGRCAWPPCFLALVQ